MKKEEEIENEKKAILEMKKLEAQRKMMGGLHETFTD
jgi:hypothetical protein